MLYEKCQLSKEQVGFFRHNGYLVADGLYTEEQIDQLEQAYEVSIPGRMRDFTHGDWKKDDPDVIAVYGLHDVQRFHANWTRYLLDHQPLINAFIDLMGPNVQLHHTKLFYKGTGKGIGFPMHQDAAWMQHEKDSLLAAIVHLTDATEEMGCLKVYPKSHKLGNLPVFSQKGRYLDPDQYPIDGATTVPAKRGDVLFFHYLTIHGSDVNYSRRARKTVLIQVNDPTDKSINGQHDGGHGQGLMLAGSLVVD